MIEICPQLFVGNQNDYEFGVKGQGGWAVVQACKHPYHRVALGYRGNAAPKLNPEYLFAKRHNRLILNMIDADDPRYIPAELVDTAIAFIAEQLEDGTKVLVHCNQGRSRSPAIGLLYLVSHTNLVPKACLEDAEIAYRRIYAPYFPAMGIRGYMLRNWTKYAGGQDGILE